MSIVHHELPSVLGPARVSSEAATKKGAPECVLVASDLMSPEVDAHDRREWHEQALAHRAARTVRVGPNAVLIFEDQLTVRHQLQEMLRVERISEPVSMLAEIDTYAALIPDGSNLKATFMLEFADTSERRAVGPGLVGVERRVWIRVEGHVRSRAAVDPGVDAAASGGVPLTHRLTFELGRAAVRDLTNGGLLSVGIDHRNYHAVVVLREDQRRLLLDDLR
jgi:hypothetical protein